jgi:hypothetical protein
VSKSKIAARRVNKKPDWRVVPGRERLVSGVGRVIHPSFSVTQQGNIAE